MNFQLSVVIGKLENSYYSRIPYREKSYRERRILKINIILYSERIKIYVICMCDLLANMN